MTQNRFGLRELSGLAGAAAAVASTWLAWYRFTFPEQAIQGLGNLGNQAGGQALGSLFRSFGQLAHAVGPVNVDAWTALHSASVALVIAAVAGAAAMLVGDEVVPGGAIGVAGLVVIGIAGYHVFARPLPAQVLSLSYGAFVACAGGAAMIVAGLLRPTPRRAAPQFVPAAPAWAAQPDPQIRRWAGS